jgi:hypothetical protein
MTHIHSLQCTCQHCRHPHSPTPLEREHVSRLHPLVPMIGLSVIAWAVIGALALLAWGAWS